MKERFIADCPFCGSDRVYVLRTVYRHAKRSDDGQVIFDESHSYRDYALCCSKCGCESGSYVGADIAIKKWNRGLTGDIK